MRKRAVYEATTKIGSILTRFDALVRDASESGRPLQAVQNMHVQVKQIQQALRRQILEI
jgi:hypothetical protein